ncbi:MAG: hypothetical protein B7X90_15020 [Novosphingobium sp. 17-62-19]|nr:MAG: hypothetical protein B7X90_15020 [Novosphingobium sp. 17-62-19]
MSLLTREMLLHMNCALFSLIDTDLSEVFAELNALPKAQRTTTLAQMKLFGRDPNLQEMARAFFPYWVMAQDNVYPHFMPFSGTNHSTSFEFILQITAIQLRFILAHEYAHLRFDHFDIKNRTLEERTQIEIQADQFAYEHLTEKSARTNEFSVGMIWIATRWLFRYQIGEAVTGRIIRGRSLDLDDLAINTRRIALYKLFGKEISAVEHLIAERGHIILISLTALLREHGGQSVLDLWAHLGASRSGDQGKQARNSLFDPEFDTWKEEYKWWKNL